MTHNPSVVYRTLGADQQWGYRALTFPALGHLLDRLDDGDVMALGVDDAAGKPIGLVLGAEASGEDGARRAQLLSIYVEPASRRNGIAAGLLAAFTDLCRGRGCAEISATYMSGQPTTAGLERLLASAEWTQPETRMLVVRSSRDACLAAPWMRDFPVPEGMEIVRWLDLTEADRAEIAESQFRGPWIPPDLYPFDHESNCEPVTSLALKHNGQVVGWTINHAIGGILRFTCAYVHPRLHKMARILLLYNAAAVRMPEAGFNAWICAVPVRHRGHETFARRYFAPYATRFDETRGTKRVL
jgi:GNAT superfamily N-acetyltransferase